MNNHIRQTDTSGELLIHRWGNGVKLIKPHTTLSDSEYSVANILKLPFNICFLNTSSVLQNMSETCVEICGMTSKSFFIGKNALDFTSTKHAERLFMHDKQVMHENIIKIYHEEAECNKDHQCLQFISVKSPWYNANNIIIGIFNFAIALGNQALEDGLMLISKLGLLDTHKHRQLIEGNKIGNIYLSQREKECLHLYVRGKTAKNIAKLLDLSHRTIEHYLENIKKKLHVKSKSELIDKTIDFFR